MLWRKAMFSLAASALLLVGASISLTQDRPAWKAGDKVQTYNPTTTLWERATVIKVEDWRSYGRGFWYRVRLDDPKAANPEFATTPDRIRALGTQGESKPTGNTPNNPAPQRGAAGSRPGGYKTGDRVDVFYNATQGKNRGTIIEVGDGKYKVHYSGCTQAWDEWVDRSQVHPPATISPSAPEIRFLIGKWAMFTASYPTTVTRGTNIYREYGPGAKSPPLQINADGTYVWYFDYGKAPVRGNWTPDAKVEGADSGTQAQIGILIKDPTGQEWKVYRWIVKSDNEDRVTAHKMCSGVADVGTRIR